MRLKFTQLPHNLQISRKVILNITQYNLEGNQISIGHSSEIINEKKAVLFLINFADPIELITSNPPKSYFFQTRTATIIKSWSIKYQLIFGSICQLIILSISNLFFRYSIQSFPEISNYLKFKPQRINNKHH